MNNTLLLLDIIAGSLSVMAKAQDLLQKAATENRDVTEQELKTLRVDNDSLEKEILGI